MRPNSFTCILLALIGLNLAVGAAAYRYLGRIDADYSRLLGEGIPFLNSMQGATGLASRTYALKVDREQAATPAEAARIEAEMDHVRQMSDQIFASPLNDRAIPSGLKPAFEAIKEFRVSTRELRQRHLALLREGRSAEASAFLRAPGVTDQELAEVAQLASLADETPEGRSIVALARSRYGLRDRDAAELGAVFVSFTAQTRMSGVDIGTRRIRKGAQDAVQAWLQSQGSGLPKEVQQIVDTVSRRGATALVVADGEAIPVMIDELHGSKRLPPFDPNDFDEIYIVTTPWYGKVKTLRLHYGASSGVVVEESSEASGG